MFKRIADDRLKIQLSCEDMGRLDITYEQLDYNDRQTRKVILLLLELAQKQVEFELGSAKLFVEAYPCEDEGCVIYFTLLGEEEQNPAQGPLYSPVVFKFENLETLTDCSYRLFVQYCHRIYKSELYYLDGDFLLVVYPFETSDNRTTAFLGEYSKKVGEGEMLAAWVEEHASPVMELNAVDQLAYLAARRGPLPSGGLQGRSRGARE